MQWLHRFVAESNRIEGITRDPTKSEIEAHQAIIGSAKIGLAEMAAFVNAVQPGALLRSKRGMNVYVGSHVPPKGGKHIVAGLQAILGRSESEHPYALHQAYETLHPYMDGNGRSGRVLWLWMMLRRSARDASMAQHLGFLHTWYYQSLDFSRLRSKEDRIA